MIMFSEQPHHIVLSLHQPVGWQHGPLHGSALEHPFDLTANAADPEGLAPLRRVPAGQNGDGVVRQRATGAVRMASAKAHAA